jgi:acetoin utilization deacetylase AcuC-like enzyme
MKKVGFVYDDIFLQHAVPKLHPETRNRLEAVISALSKSELADKLIHIKPRIASVEDVALVHATRYIAKVRALGEGYLDCDTYLSPGSCESALCAAGAVIEAIERCRRRETERVFCAVRPPGHHAEERSAMGFCIFNNVAIGARYAQKAGFRKIFIIDFDVHHGNGTQHIFESDNTVFYFSTHQSPLYPGTGSRSEKGKGEGEGFTCNVTMDAGTGDAEFIKTYQDFLPPLVRKFSPDLVLVSAGYDIMEGDPLAGLSVSREGLRIMIQSILKCSRAPSIFALEGGYNLPSLGEAVMITLREMLK